MTRRRPPRGGAFLAAVAISAVLFAAGCASRPPELTLEEAIAHATTPRPGNRERHAEILAARDAMLDAGSPPRLVFVGDSITQGWEDEGHAVWKEKFAPRNALNLGSAGDQTAHVLWRLGPGKGDEVAGLEPDVYVVLIGTNNTLHYRGMPEATAAGVEAIVRRLGEESPSSRVLLLGLLPRGRTARDPLRQVNQRVNELIGTLGELEGVEFLDVGKSFVDDRGSLPASLMPDGLHPNVAGYRRLADAIEPHLAWLSAERLRPDEERSNFVDTAAPPE